MRDRPQARKVISETVDLKDPPGSGEAHPGHDSMVKGPPAQGRTQDTLPGVHRAGAKAGAQGR